MKANIEIHTDSGIVHYVQDAKLGKAAFIEPLLGDEDEFFTIRQIANAIERDSTFMFAAGDAIKIVEAE